MATAPENEYYTRDDGKIYVRLNILPESRRDVLEVGWVLEKRWDIRAKLGEGSHSEVYCAYDNELKQEVAIKANTSKKRLLSEEAAILRKLEHSQYFCRLIKCPIIDSVHMLIMDMKGPCLGEITHHYQPLSLESVLRLSIQMIEAIEDLHSVGIIHGDIKPANYVTGLPPSEMGKIFLIDFSLSKKYLNDKNKLILPEVTHSGFPGTLKYCSPVLQQTRQLCRRDDLYSMLYIMLELRTNLPWNTMISAIDVLHLKLQMTDLLLRDKIDIEMIEFKEILRNLQYQDTPDYKQLKSILESVMHHRKIDKKGIFEWEVNPHRIWRVLDNEERRRSLSRSRDRAKIANSLLENDPHSSKSYDKHAVIRQHSKKLIAAAATQHNDNNNLSVIKDIRPKKRGTDEIPKITSQHGILRTKSLNNQTIDNDKKPKTRANKKEDSQPSLDSSLFQDKFLKKRQFSNIALICSYVFRTERGKQSEYEDNICREYYRFKIVNMAPMKVY